MWSELDALYNLHVLTAEERVKILLRKPKVLKDDVGGHILLMADLRTVWREAEDADMDRQLDRPEIIRDIVMGRIPYMGDKFVTKEMKSKIKEPSARLKFKDMVEMVTLKAGMLKAKGEYVLFKQPTVEKPSARVAAAATTRGQYRTGDQARTNYRPERISDSGCSFCSKDHQSELCPKWLDMDSMTHEI